MAVRAVLPAGVQPREAGRSMLASRCAASTRRGGAVVARRGAARRARANAASEATRPAHRPSAPRVRAPRRACARPAARFLLVVGHPPEGGHDASRGDGQKPSRFTVCLGARLSLDKRPESWLDDSRSAGEKGEPRGGEGPQPMKECAAALRVGFGGMLWMLRARVAHATVLIKVLWNRQANLSLAAPRTCRRAELARFSRTCVGEFGRLWACLAHDP